MENVTLSKEELEQQRQQEVVENELTDAPRKGRKFADIVSRQVPSDFEAAAEPAEEAEEPQPEAETPEQPEPEEETLAQEEGEEDGQKPDSEPLLPEFLSEQIAEAFPDEKIESVEQAQELMSRVIGDAKALDAERKANDKLYQIFENSEEMVSVVREMNKGRSFLEAVAATVNIEETLSDLKEADPEQYKKVVRAQVEREKALEEQKKQQEALEKQFEENGEASRKAIDQFKKEKQIDEAQSKEFIATLNQHFDDMVAGKVTPEYLDIMHKGMSYEQDLAAAKEQGRIEGRNEKIDAEKSKKQGDNLPHLPKGPGKRAAGTEPTASKGKRALAILAANSQSDF